MKHAMTLNQQDIVLKKGAEMLPKIEGRWSMTSQQHTLLKGAEEKGKDYRSWMSKGLCVKGAKCSFEHDPRRMGGAGGIDQETRLNETNQQNDNTPERQ